MEKIEEIRQAVEAITRACGSLQKRYDEGEALALIRALGQHCRVTERSLVGASPDQQAAREALHATCLNIESAIRRAVSRPGRAEHEQAVVEQVRRLHSLTRSMRQQFGWSEPGHDVSAGRRPSSA